jgi:two-component system, sporulation sensor kinase A
MGWKGRAVSLIIVVVTYLSIHYVSYESDLHDVNGRQVLVEAVFGLTTLLAAYWAGRQYDKTTYYIKQNASSSQLIEELSRKERELRESEERYKGLLEQMPDSVFVYCQGRVVYANPAGLELHGYSSDQLMEMHYEEVLGLVHPEDVHTVIDLLPDRTHSKPIEPMEFRLRRRDGDYKEVEMRYQRIVYRGERACQVVIRDLTGLKQSERKLMAAQQELRDVLRNQQGITFKYKRRHDKSFVHTLWDGELAYDMGLPPEYVMGQTLTSIFAPEIVNVMSLQYDKAWEEGSVVVFEADLMQVPCLITLKPIVRMGKVEEVVGYCTDMTIRKKTEEELLRTKEMLESFFNNTSDAINVCDLDGYILHTNLAFGEMFGWPFDEIIGRKLEEIVPPFLYGEYEDLQEAVRYGGHISGYETMRLRKNGEIFDVSVTISPIRNDKGETLAIAAISRDITESKRVEAKLRRSENKYRLIAENMTDIISVLDKEGRITYISPSCKTMLGLDPDMFMDRPITEFMHPDDWLTIMQHPACSETLELRFKHAEGHWVTMEATNRTIPDLNKGNAMNLLVVARDITERKKTEEMLLKSEKLSVVGQLAAGVAHEIRNPLTSLKGFLQLLKERSPDNGFFFEVMLSELERINTIVSEFLVLSKPQTVKFMRHNVAKVVMDVVSFLESQALLNNVQIVPEILTSPLLELECDENQLKQVFINLLKNAVEAMPGGGIVQVMLMQPEPGKLLVRFSDQGPGIPVERIPKLGEPFYTTKEKGTGLGLMVSFRIIEDHGGTIRVSSQLDIGTVFDVELPLLKARA